MSDTYFTPTTPRWLVMWGLSFAVYLGFKLLTWKTRHVSAPLWKHFAYVLAWPGMDVDAFLDTRLLPPPPTMSEWLFSIIKMAIGIGLLWSTRLFKAYPLLTGWIAMTGIILALHCGLFHLLSCVWRRCGINAAPLFNWPVASQSLTEFWGRRWNRAFRDLTYRFLFRPLTSKLGPVTALVIGFVVSGIVHELVISFPAGGGWGGPTFFFSLQAAGILVERSQQGRVIGRGRGIVGWTFCVLLIVVPSPLLFHEPFVTRIILPFLTAIGVSS